ALERARTAARTDKRSIRKSFIIAQPPGAAVVKSCRGKGDRARCRGYGAGYTSQTEEARMNRREFARLLAIGGAVPFVTPNAAWARPSDLPPTPASPDERFWTAVRDQFVMPRDLTMLNAANLCPSS